jgi:hypothetical protein
MCGYIYSVIAPVYMSGVSTGSRDVKLTHSMSNEYLGISPKDVILTPSLFNEHLDHWCRDVAQKQPVLLQCYQFQPLNSFLASNLPFLPLLLPFFPSRPSPFFPPALGDGVVVMSGKGLPPFFPSASGDCGVVVEG